MRVSSFVPSEEIFNTGLDGIKVGKKENEGELFSNVLKESLDKINEQQIVADKSTEAFVKGEDIDISEEEILKFKTACMLFFAKEYYDLDWAMQLHFGVKRENNSKLFDENLIVYINEVDSSQMLEVMKRGYIEMSQINLELAEECVDEISDYETWLCGV